MKPIKYCTIKYSIIHTTYCKNIVRYYCRRADIEYRQKNLLIVTGIEPHYDRTFSFFLPH